MDYYHTSHGNVTWQSLDKLNNCEAIKRRKTQTVSPLQKFAINQFAHHWLLNR